MKTDQEAWDLTKLLEIDYICHRLHSFKNIHSCNCVYSVVKRIVLRPSNVTANLWPCESMRVFFRVCNMMKLYVSLQLRVQNAVSAQPCVGKLRISLVLLNFLHCNFRLWFETT